MSTTINNNNVATYKWVIASFSKISSQYAPDKFGFPVDNGTLFRLYINPSFANSHLSDTCVSISIYLYAGSQSALNKVKYRMLIMNAKEDKCNTQEGISIFTKGKFNAHYDILRDVLMDSANGLLVNDTLTILCEIELVKDGEELQVKPGGFSSISQHYESLLESGKHSDVVLSIGEKEFRAHKLVLCARSPVFAAMFDHADTKEAQQGRVEIVDVAVEVFELFVRYLYTDKIDQLDRFAPELLAVADLYQMDCLKSLCEHFLCSTLTIENVSELLIHADMYRAEVLKCKCIDYITDNSEKVRITEGWNVLSKKIDLVLALFVKISIKHSASK